MADQDELPSVHAPFHDVTFRYGDLFVGSIDLAPQVLRPTVCRRRSLGVGW